MEHVKSISGTPESDLLADFKLLPGEQVLRPVVTHEPRIFSRVPSSLEQIYRLTRSSRPEDIGKFGPSLAAIAFEATDLAEPSPKPNTSSTPEHLKLYETLFGRDSLRVAIDLISSYPLLARNTILELASYQGLDKVDQREEEPGRIVHEVRDRDDPVAQQLTSERGWDWPYYGSVDATPEYIRTLTAYCQKSEENHGFLFETYLDRNGQEHKIADSLEQALAWIEKRLDDNPEGILEYKSVLPNGIENQVWKDSWDAYHHADGQIANHSKGIASIEVQVTTYDALIDAAELFEDILVQTDIADKLRARADKLKKTILETFWTEEKGGFFVLGTDRDEKGKLRQMRIRTSNMGHVLNSRILKGDEPEIVRKRQATVDHILSPEMLNVSGIRTLASDEYRFRPGSYHNGSVWLWDTHHIAKGLRRLGYDSEAMDIDNRLLNIVNTTRIFPEYVRGDDSDTPSVNRQTILLWDENHQRINKVEQPPQEVQAWTVAAILATKKRRERSGQATDLL